MTDETTLDILPPSALTQTREKNAARSYIASLPSRHSRRSQTQALGKIAELLTGGKITDPFVLKWEALRFEHTSALRTILISRLSRDKKKKKTAPDEEPRYAPATVNRYLVALRQTLKHAWQLRLMSAEEYQWAANLKPAPGKTVPAGREMTREEVNALITDCVDDDAKSGARDAAIIALLDMCGLRRSELADLNLADYESETGRLLIRGKRSKERTVYVVNETARALEDWLLVRGSRPGPLFVPIHKGGKIKIARLTPQAIYYRLRVRGRRAGIKKSFSPHDLRRTFVSNMLDAGADIAIVAQLAGHESINTTARYDRRPEEAKREALKLIHTPYRGRRVAGDTKKNR